MSDISQNFHTMDNCEGELNLIAEIKEIFKEVEIKKRWWAFELCRVQQWPGVHMTQMMVN